MKEVPEDMKTVIRPKEKLVEPRELELMKRPAWKPPELMIRDGGLEYKNWKSRGGD